MWDNQDNFQLKGGSQKMIFLFGNNATEGIWNKNYKHSFLNWWLIELHQISLLEPLATLDSNFIKNRLWIAATEKKCYYQTLIYVPENKRTHI